MLFSASWARDKHDPRWATLSKTGLELSRFLFFVGTVHYIDHRESTHVYDSITICLLRLRVIIGYRKTLIEVDGND